MTDLDALAAAVQAPDHSAERAARERQDLLAKPPGSLGRLEDLSAWLAAAQGRCPPRPIERARVVVFAGDHGVAGTGVAGTGVAGTGVAGTGVAATGVSAYPPEVTAQLVRHLVAGGGAVNVLARAAGATVRVLDLGVDADLSDLPAAVRAYKVRRGCGDIASGPALTLDEAETAFAAGVAIADEEVDAGADLLVAGDLGIGSSTAAATLVVVLTEAEVAAMVGRGTGIDDRAWMVKCAAVRDAARRGRRRAFDPIALLAEVGSADLAAVTGFLVQAAVRRTPVLLDGVAVSAAALVAERVAPGCSRWWLAGHRSPEPAHARALQSLRLEPLLDYGMRLGAGTGALLALPILQAAALTLAEMATHDEAAVSGRT